MCLVQVAYRSGSYQTIFNSIDYRFPTKPRAFLADCLLAARDLQCRCRDHQRGIKGISPTAFPARMKVGYVRVY